jgi:hypothetical protein
MIVVFTVDVEEQGLFSNRYSRFPAVDNVLHLDRLEQITSRYNLPLTLLTTYPVIRNQACRDMLCRLTETSGAEIGAHLHPWNTPPFDNEGPDFLRSAAMPKETLAAKLSNLVEAITVATGTPPVSFRMGRFDFSDAVRELLPAHGLRVDSSAVPLQDTPAGTRYFLGQTDPYKMDTAQGPILEAPPTMAAIVPGSARIAAGLAGMAPAVLSRQIRKWFKMLGRVGVQPMGFPLPSMKAAARLHQRRGGRVLSIYLHSSELSPGHHPRLPDQDSVEAYLGKIDSFLSWLATRHSLEGRTLSGLLESTWGPCTRMP